MDNAINSINPMEVSMNRITQRLARRFLPALFVFSAGIATAQDTCYRIIELSKTVRTSTSNSNEVDAHARNFCEEYRRYRSNKVDSDFGASYKFLSASFSSGSASVDDVASKYCDAVNDFHAKSSAYQDYVENIAPAAFSALQTCLTQGVVFDLQGHNTKEATLKSFYRTGPAGSKVRLTFSTSNDVHCDWDRSGSKVEEVKLGEQGLLKCVRARDSVASYITLAGLNDGATLTLPWVAYDASGVPMDTLAKVTASVKKMQDAIRYNALPIGTVIPWLRPAAAVPAGWVKCDGSDGNCPDLTGLFLRGSNAAGANQTGGADSFVVPWLGSDNSDPGGNGWKKDDDSRVSNEHPTISLVPRHRTVLYIMKVANM